MVSDRPDRLPLPWQDETVAVHGLKDSLRGQLDWSSVRQRCQPWIDGVRRHPGPAWALESLLHEFPLTSQEGLALMRLAEALLRVPDADTALALTADQLRHGAGLMDASAPGNMPSRPVSGLVQQLSHRVLDLARRLLPATDHAPQGWLQRLGAPTVVAATVRTVQLLGRQFVLGQTIDEALSNARELRIAATARGQRLAFSFDMLGEGARTWADAERYAGAYQQALDALAREPLGDGLSIKLSALHPRFEPAHTAQVIEQLMPTLSALAVQASQSGVLLTLDAEESWRLELQLAVLDALLDVLAHKPSCRDWQGLGLAVQAYQMRAPAAIDAVQALAERHQRRLTVRLVKGAYWDGEIKRAQELGLPGYPVFTRKAHTDLSYMACAQRLLRHREHLSPQFATHNAATVAAVMQLAEAMGIEAHTLEWQRLFGMGEATWREVLASVGSPALAPLLRVYAPVGAHRDLLAYLVRRLLENGANSSFVHQLVDPDVHPDVLLGSPLLAPDGPADDVGLTSPRRAQGPERLLAIGRDVQVQAHRTALMQAFERAHKRPLAPVLSAPDRPGEIDALMHRLDGGFERWEARPPAERVAVLQRVADRLDSELDSWAADLVLEARKTWPDAVAEVRETIDLARYYALQAQAALAERTLPGVTGELNRWQLRGRGVWVCIAPWNFPLAIFGGQVMAALVMGNTVVAKPAEATPRIARRLVGLLHELGVPDDVLQLACGPGSTVGHALVSHPLCAGVAFTGSVATARRIQQALMADPQRALVPLLAETGGLNALIADSTALPEQLLDSVVHSAFGSAGQRCSALRLLCLHASVAGDFERLLAGALDTLCVGRPEDWRTDVGPVIDQAAQARLRAHVDRLDTLAQDAASGVRRIGQAPAPWEPADSAPWVPPLAFALPGVDALTEEHFGPILHVVHWGPGTRAPTLDHLIDQINASGYGLTLGVHTRIEARAEHIARRARVGNVYVNRGMTGAVVGAQPFGGRGLSGTGPKAGGPLYLHRFATEQVVSINTAAAGGNAALMTRSGG